MDTSEQFTSVIAENIRKAQREELIFKEIFTDPKLPVGKNEFLFFIKPEITLASSSIRLEKILEMIYEEIMSFGLGIHNIIVLSARYLKQYNIIAQHYGVINHIASNAVKYMSEHAQEAFRQIYGQPVSEVKALGGVEFLQTYKGFDARSLGTLWQNGDFKKLAGGTYCVKVNHDGETIYLFNGFHPSQLEHFNEQGRSIVVMTLSGDLPWHVARNDFIGSTNPANAAKNSLRRVFLDNQNRLGLSGISASANGVHLSAGPVEALVELKRYNSDFSDPSKTRNWQDFSFGRKLKEIFPDAIIGQITDNVDLHVDGKSISVFDLTEEMDSDEALKVLARHF